MTERQIILLAQALLGVIALVYCRIVSGQGPFIALRDLSGLRPQERKARKRKEVSAFATPAYEDISLTGGNGRGTVTEILARQTQIRIAEGEQVEDDLLSENVKPTDAMLEDSAPEPRLQDTSSSNDSLYTADPVKDYAGLEPYLDIDLEFPEDAIKGRVLEFDDFSVGNIYVAEETDRAEPID